jgi:hypothetical protein
VIAMLAGVDLGEFSWELKLSASVVMCVAYACAAASLPVFLHAIDEVTPVPVLVALLAGAAAATVATHELVTELREGRQLGLALLVASAVLGLGIWARSRRTPKGEDRYVGMHDETLVSSVLLPPSAPRDGHGR